MTDPRAEAVGRRYGLTATECRVMALTIDGCDSAQKVALRIGGSDRTVELHIGRIKAKLGAASKLEAALIFDRALRNQPVHQEEIAMPGQYAITVSLWKQDRLWHAQSDQMSLGLAHSSRGILLSEVWHAVHAEYGGKRGTLTIVVPLADDEDKGEDAAKAAEGGAE